MSETSTLALLRRIREWDHLDTAGDGAYWKREIDRVLTLEEHASEPSLRERIAREIYNAHGVVYEYRVLGRGDAIPLAELIERKRAPFLATADRILALVRTPESQGEGFLKKYVESLKEGYTLTAEDIARFKRISLALKNCNQTRFDESLYHTGGSE